MITEVLLTHLEAGLFLAILLMPSLLAVAGGALPQRRAAFSLIAIGFVAGLGVPLLREMGAEGEGAFAHLWRSSTFAALGIALLLTLSWRRSTSALRFSALVFRALVLCVAVWLSLFLGLWAAGASAFWSAMGHGHQAAAESLSILLVTTAPALAVCLLLARLLERWALASVVGGDRLWSASLAGLAVLVFVAVGPIGEREYRFREHLYNARHDPQWTIRAAAIRALAEAGRPGALPVLRSIATDASQPASHSDRSAAIFALTRIPGGRDVLLRLSRVPDPTVRQQAGPALVRLANDAEAWAAVQALAEDPSPVVRADVSAALALASLPAERRDSAAALLRARLRDADVATRLKAACSLGGSDESAVEAVMEVVRDTRLEESDRLKAVYALRDLNNPRATDLMWRIESGRIEALAISEEGEESFRRAASEALGRILGDRPSEYPQVFAMEQAALVSVGAVVRAQFHYRESGGAFTGAWSCLVAPETCQVQPPHGWDYMQKELQWASQQEIYAYHLRPGPAQSAVDATAAPPHSVSRWAYLAVPVRHQLDLRSFCADDSGRICFTPGGSEPMVRDGRCPDSAQGPWSPNAGEGEYPRRPKPCLAAASAAAAR